MINEITLRVFINFHSKKACIAGLFIWQRGRQLSDILSFAALEHPCSMGFSPCGFSSIFIQKKALHRRAFYLAERKGFEPSIRDKPYTPLAGERLQPLGHLSKTILTLNPDTFINISEARAPSVVRRPPTRPPL